MKSTKPCNICGIVDYPNDYSGSIGKLILERGLCFTCAFWEERAKQGCPLVIDNFTYSIGNENAHRNDRGMGGRKFIIEFFDGRTVTTTNLWAGSEVPDHWRDKFPNTAKFVGASRVKVGDITCWNHSK